MSRAARSDPLAAWLRTRVDGADMPGAVWWVGSRDAEPSFGAVGLAAVEPAAEPLRVDTVFDLASLTKPLATATIAVLLEQDGVIDLDGPVASWVPELAGGPYADVTAIDLGSHRAGCPAWRPLYLEARGRDGYVRAIARQPPVGPRGEELYSDLGYILLGIALERAAGEDLASLFRTRVAYPLGLRRTAYGPIRDVADVAPTERGNAHERTMAGAAGSAHRWREGLIRGEVHDVNAFELGGVAGHAGLFGTAHEVARIAEAWLGFGLLGIAARGRGRLLGEGAPGGRTFGLERATASQAARGILPDRAVGHVGFTGTSLWLDPFASRIAVLLTHRVHPCVGRAGFQHVRAGFHRVAWSWLESRSDGLAKG